ncbi:MAG: SAM-dependent methyltransferase [Bacteroidetes bacterium]|nr:MAG: SAM-dependent methyltransferase [Bacteroidota bacterium]
MKFDEAYWSGKYRQQLMGWDTGSITTPLKEYIDQLADKNIRILVPGCGNGHEVKYLHDQGFNNVVVVDISSEPYKELRGKCSNWGEESFVVDDFFNINGQYDLIVEQTFFCALNPKLRQNYSDKMHDLLAPNGKLVGVLFKVFFAGDNPPFGGNRDEYVEYFEDKFKFNVFDDCYNSIKPRIGEELFINLIKAENISRSA